MKINIPSAELFNFQSAHWTVEPQNSGQHGFGHEHEVYDLMNLDAAGEDDLGEEHLDELEADATTEETLL